MARRAYLTAQLKHLGFMRQYQRARREIDSVDALVRALDARREAAGISKADLARRVGAKAESIRRLFTAAAPNPTLDTVLRLVVALDCRLALRPRGGHYSENLEPAERCISEWRTTARALSVSCRCRRERRSCCVQINGAPPDAKNRRRTRGARQVRFAATSS